MANIKKTVLRKKIEGVVYDVYLKTSADLVEFNDSTVAAALESIATQITDITKINGTIDTKIDAASIELYNRIMGITEEDGATVAEAYDTLKEVAIYLTEHGDVVTGIINRISALEATVGNEEAGLVKDVADLQEAMSELNSNGVSFVEASTTNGNILVNGEETVVYKHPESHPATMITEDDNHKFVTAAQLETINSAAAVEVVSVIPEDASENNLYLVEIA